MLIVFASFWALACGGVSMQQNPASTVTVEITGISSDVKKFAAGLDFGEVTEVDGRTVNVAFKE